MVVEDIGKYIECYNKLATDVLRNPLDPAYKMRFIDLKEFLHDTTNEVVIDIGSSQGLFLKEIPAITKIAFDISDVFLRVTPSEFNPVRGNAEMLPFKSSTIDTAIASDILEHVFHPELVVNEVYRVLKPGGRFYIVVPWEEDISIYDKYRGVYDYCHLRTFDNLEVLRIFNKFKIEKMRGSILKIPAVWRSYTLTRILYRVTDKCMNITGSLLIPYVHMMIEVKK